MQKCLAVCRFLFSGDKVWWLYTCLILMKILVMHVPIRVYGSDQEQHRTAILIGWPIQWAQEMPSLCRHPYIPYSVLNPSVPQPNPNDSIPNWETPKALQFVLTNPFHFSQQWKGFQSMEWWESHQILHSSSASFQQHQISLWQINELMIQA